jgi:hypothetical protein
MHVSMAQDKQKAAEVSVSHAVWNTYPKYFPDHTRTVITSPQEVDQNIWQQPCTFTLTTCRHFST